MVMRLASTPLHRTITIRKLNNITINCLIHSQLSLFADKWWFDTSQEQELQGDNFDRVRPDTIPDGIFQALGLHFSPFGYFEERLQWFVDITHKLELVIKLENNDQLIMDSEDEKARKELKRVIKKKVGCNNLRASIQTPATGFAAFLLSCS